MRLLVVDDDPLFLEICGAYLAALGYDDAVFMTSAREALRHVEEVLLPYECLLIDIGMPGVSGIEMTRALRSIPRYDRVPVVMITASTDARAVEAAFAAGATDYIGKPLEREQLKGRLDSIERLLRDRTRLTGLSAVLDQGGERDLSRLKFEDPAPLRGVVGLVDYVALQNLAITKGRLRHVNSPLLWWRVRNARELFRELDRASYVELLTDLADLALDALDPMEPTLAHAGGGDFVAMLHPNVHLDPSALEATMNAAAATLNDFNGRAARLRPQILVGEAIEPARLPQMPAADLLDRARRSVETRHAA